ncbi:MAG: hypothetical protein ACJATS_002513 [Psychroserpens sp.]|jgi:hypothetical protein
MLVVPIALSFRVFAFEEDATDAGYAAFFLFRHELVFDTNLTFETQQTKSTSSNSNGAFAFLIKLHVCFDNALSNFQ